MKNKLFHFSLVFFPLLIALNSTLSAYAVDSELIEIKPYRINYENTLTITDSLTTYNLYEKVLFADANGDDRFNSTDARILLRMAAKIDEIPDDISGIDVTEDGKISSTDARLSLRYAAKLDTYYVPENGRIVSGFLRKDNEKTIYLNEFGAIASGDNEINGNTYTFDQNNEMVTGWVNKDLNSYYYDDNGIMQKNTEDENYIYSEDGSVNAKTLNRDTFHVYLCDILKRIGTSPEAIYSYVHENYRYKYFEKEDPIDMAIRILKNGRGACYDFANLTKFLFETAGYDCLIIIGDSFNPNNGNEHDWVLVNIDGVWRHVDTQRGYYMQTDNDMRLAGYGWNSTGLPSAD